MKYMMIVAAVLLASGCTTTEIKDISTRLAVVEAEVQHLKSMAHEPTRVTK